MKLGIAFLFCLAVGALVTGLFTTQKLVANKEQQVLYSITENPNFYSGKPVLFKPSERITHIISVRTIPNNGIKIRYDLVKINDDGIGEPTLSETYYDRNQNGYPEQVEVIDFDKSFTKNYADAPSAYSAKMAILAQKYLERLQ